VIVSAGEIPEVLFEADRTEGCAPLSATFTYTGNAQPGHTYKWVMDDGTTYPGASVTHVYTQEFCHDVSLTVTNAQGCMATHALAQYICVDPAPVASFTHVPEPIFVDNPHVQFINTSTAHVAAEWQLGDGATSTEENPQYTYALGEGNDYMVRLIVVSDKGCADTVWNTVTVRFRFNMFVPNAFTPDGDTHNPMFMPTVAAPFDVGEYLLRIYDRWGTELFSSTALPYGWDGTTKDKTLPEGIYTWKINIRDPYTKRQIVKTGHVTLIR
jgi:gliding motility-associated-like protein